MFFQPKNHYNNKAHPKTIKEILRIWQNSTFRRQ